MFSEALLKTEASRFSEYSVLLIELFRTKALTCDHFTYMKPDPQSSEKSVDPWESGQRDCKHFPELKLPPVYMQMQSAEEKPVQKRYEQCCLLVSRILSLLPMELNDYPWFDEVSKDLLAFNTIVKALHKTLRNLIEVVAAVLFLDSRTTIDPYHYHDLPQTLPFGQESNTAMGVVIDYIMRNGEDFGKEDIKNREQRLAHLKVCFYAFNLSYFIIIIKNWFSVLQNLQHNRINSLAAKT